LGKFKQANEMSKIFFSGRTTECNEGANLRRVLLEAKLPLYNSIAGAIHCRGLGTCGTCAVEIEGSVSEMTKVEKWRLGFPPHRSDSGLRLACQCKILGDLKITKHGGMWGNQIVNES
jgi:ferredoxin